MKKIVVKTIISIGAISVAVLGAVLCITKLIRSKKAIGDIKVGNAIKGDTVKSTKYVDLDLDCIELYDGLDLCIDRENDGDVIEDE